MTDVLALAGAPASGKTTVARLIAAELAAARVGFGDLVRSRVRAHGLADNRTAWQDVGAQLHDSLGANGLIAAALTHAALTPQDVPAVWDGVRHVDVLNALCCIYAPRAVVLVVLRPPEAERRARFLREAGSEEQLLRWEGHNTEQHLDELTAAANLVCEHDTAAEAADAILAYLAAD